MVRLDAQYMTQHQKNNHGANDNHGDRPVTVIVTRKSKKGKIKEFEEWMDSIIHEAMRFEGHVFLLHLSNMESLSVSDS
jgi:hypothetical protein